MSFIGPGGPEIPTAAEILEIYRNTYEGIADEEQDWGEDTFLGAHSIAHAQMLAPLGATIQDLWDCLSLESAPGPALDKVWGALLKRPRRAATQSRARVTIENTGSSSTTRSPGDVYADDNGEEWVSLEAVTIDAEETAEIPVEAVSDGAIFADSGEITELLTDPAGIDVLGNENPAIRGRPRERNERYRARLREASKAGNGISYLGLRDTIRELPFVETAEVVHNPESEEQVVKQVTLPPHSLATIVYPPELTQEEEEELFDIIEQNSAPGITQAAPPELDGLTVETFRSGYPLRFSYAAELEVEITGIVIYDPDYDADTVAFEVAEATLDLVRSTPLGRGISVFDVIGAIQGVDGVVNYVPKFNGVPLTDMGVFEPAAFEYMVVPSVNLATVASDEI